MRRLFIILSALASVAATAAQSSAKVSRPFMMPLAARSAETSKDGKGWLESGVMAVPFVQAEGSFKSAMAQSGWKYLHSVALGSANAHTLYTWRRGDTELTLMLRRIDVNRTSFSWGIAKTGKR